jgi:hypothetical protein
MWVINMSYVILGAPPIQNNVVEGQKLSTQYRTYLTNLNSTIQATILPTNFTSGVSGQTQMGVVLQHPTYLYTSEIDSMSPPDGVSVYDAQANQFKFRVNGVWEVFP